MPVSSSIEETRDSTPQESSLEQPNYFDYEFARPRVKKISDDWVAVDKEAQRLRNLRYIRVDKESLKSDGIFKEDETYVATRLIDSNIRSEQPQYINYLTQSRRSMIFECLDSDDETANLGETPGQPASNPQQQQKPKKNIQKLESLFTKAARYKGWQRPFIKAIDGAATHAWDIVEVILDDTKGGHFAIEHVGHENLMFDADAEDIGNQELLLRKIKYTALQLRAATKAPYNFNSTQVEKIIESDPNNESKTKDIQYELLKCYFKADDGFVYIFWAHEKCDDFIKPPEMFFLGRYNLISDMLSQQQTLEKIYETEYPFYILPYIESEEQKITELRGRAFLDEPAQEAASAILSGIVNTTIQSAQVYGSPENNPANTDSAPPAQIQVLLKGGLIYDKKINFWSRPPPDPTSLRTFELLTTANKAETSKVDAAVNNRKDSRKTATEIQASTEEANKLSSVQVINFSTFIAEVYTRCWEIYSNRVKVGKIKVSAEIRPMFDYEYQLSSSGDIDVLKRQEKVQRMMQAWPVVAKTSLGPIFLEDIIINLFPDEADRYIAVLRQPDPRQIIIALFTILQAIVSSPEISGQMKEFMPQLMQLGQTVNQYLTMSNAQDVMPPQMLAQMGGGGSPSSNGSPSNSPKEESNQPDNETMTVNS